MNRLQQQILGRALPIALVFAGTGIALAAEAIAPVQSDAVLTPPVTGLVVIPDIGALNYSSIKPSELPDPIEVKGPEFLNTEKFERAVSKYIGVPLSNATLEELQRDIILFCRSEGHYVVDVSYVTQTDVTDGVIQIIVQEGKLRNVTVNNEGRKYSTDEAIIEASGLTPGEPVLEGEVRKRFTRLNQNRVFRQVTPRLSQGAELGTVDAELLVKDRFPLRPFIGYDNYGTPLLGEDRVNAGFTWFNSLLNLDHELTYQYTSDLEFQHYAAHALTYRMPLPWKNHSFVVSGVYSEVEGDFEAIELPEFKQDEGNNSFASARYIAPLPTLKRFEHHLRVGFDFRRVENSLEFGEEGNRQPVPSSPFDVAQFSAGYHFEVPDSLGFTAFDVETFYSPGDLTDNNSDEAFQSQRPGTEADYTYIRLRADRALKLPLISNWKQKAPDENFTLYAAGTYQMTSDSLIITEQLIIGGIGTVRGYPERFQSGDEGYTINAELRTPSIWSYVPWGKRMPDSHLYFFGFFDYGSVENNDSGSGQDLNLYSAGAGLSLAVGDHFHLRVDSGYPLAERDLIELFGEDTGLKTQVAVQLAF